MEVEVTTTSRGGAPDKFPPDHRPVGYLYHENPPVHAALTLICPSVGLSEKLTPSMTSAEGIRQYKEIYAREIGGELTDQQAEEQATRLLNAFKVITGPMPKTWLPRYLELLEEHLSKNNNGQRKNI